MQNFTESQTRLAFIQYIFQLEFYEINQDNNAEEFEKYFYNSNIASIGEKKEFKLKFNKNYFKKLTENYVKNLTRIKELAKEFVDIGVKAVVLIGGGEPMAHPEFGTLVDYFYENDIHVGVTSNGTLIHKYAHSLAYHTKWVRISVDAGCEETCQQYRPHASGKSQFNKVIDGMKKLAEGRTTKLGFSFLVCSKAFQPNLIS